MGFEIACCGVKGCPICGGRGYTRAWVDPNEHDQWNEIKKTRTSTDELKRSANTMDEIICRCLGED